MRSILDAQAFLSQKLNFPNRLEENFFNYLEQKGINTAFARGAKLVADINFYEGKAVVGLTSVKYFYGSPTVGTSYTNLASFIRPEGEHAILYGYRLWEGAGAALNAIAWDNGITTTDLKNGELTIDINGTVLLKKVPMFDSIEADEDSDAGFVPLLEPIIWPEQQILNVTLDFPVAPATANQAVLVELLGLGLI